MSNYTQKLSGSAGEAEFVRLRKPEPYIDKVTKKEKRRTMLQSNVSFYAHTSESDTSGWTDAKELLRVKCQSEDWGGARHVILHNYVTQLFDAIAKKYLSALAEAGNIHDDDYIDGFFFTDDDKYFLFNTSLYDNHFEQIYMLCIPNNNANQQPWFFRSWSTNQELTAHNIHPREKPTSFVFFKAHHELYFTPTIELTINQVHILQDDAEHNRIPQALGVTASQSISRFDLAQKLAGAVARMLVRVKQNSRTVVPQFFDGKLQLLLPLSLKDDNTVQLVIPVSKEKKDLRRGETVYDPNNPAHWHYVGRTVLDMKMAYNNARLLNRLESEWLRPSLAAELIAACPVCNPPELQRGGAKSTDMEEDLDDETVDSTSKASSVASSFKSLSVKANKNPGPVGSHKQRDCAFFANHGKCHYGEKCINMHDLKWQSKADKPALPRCKYNNNCRNPDCLYGH